MIIKCKLNSYEKMFQILKQCIFFLIFIFIDNNIIMIIDVVVPLCYLSRNRPTPSVVFKSKLYSHRLYKHCG